MSTALNQSVASGSFRSAFLVAALIYNVENVDRLVTNSVQISELEQSALAPSSRPTRWPTKKPTLMPSHTPNSLDAKSPSSTPNCKTSLTFKPSIQYGNSFTAIQPLYNVYVADLNDKNGTAALKKAILISLNDNSVTLDQIAITSLVVPDGEIFVLVYYSIFFHSVTPKATYSRLSMSLNQSVVSGSFTANFLDAALELNVENVDNLVTNSVQISELEQSALAPSTSPTRRPTQKPRALPTRKPRALDPKSPSSTPNCKTPYTKKATRKPAPLPSIAPASRDLNTPNCKTHPPLTTKKSPTAKDVIPTRPTRKPTKKPTKKPVKHRDNNQQVGVTDNGTAISSDTQFINIIIGVSVAVFLSILIIGFVLYRRYYLRKNSKISTLHLGDIYESNNSETDISLNMEKPETTRVNK